MKLKSDTLGTETEQQWCSFLQYYILKLLLCNSNIMSHLSLLIWKTCYN